MLPFKLKKNQLHMISLTGVRGAAAIAFAILAVNSGAKFESDIYHIVFGVCVLSSLIQGSLMPPAARKLDMLDPNDTVFQTFNYYQDKAEIGFLETEIRPDSRLVGTLVKDLNLTFDFIVAKIMRKGKPINPRGHVVLEENDLIVLAGAQYFDRDGHDLVEFTIPKGHKWIGKRIMDLSLPTNRLIVMVQRDGRPLVPQGSTLLLENDKILLQEIPE
jgi:cell volume regulation protein A